VKKLTKLVADLSVKLPKNLAAILVFQCPRQLRMNTTLEKTKCKKSFNASLMRLKDSNVTFSWLRYTLLYKALHIGKLILLNRNNY